jgi:uroporphyrinogen-III decarboxylase
MAEFREYSNKYGFRHRSETPEIAIELSLQPWRAFKPDGVIMFSDILTPLPAIGVEFDVVKVRIFIRSVSNGTPTFPFHKYGLLVADLT